MPRLQSIDDGGTGEFPAFESENESRRSEVGSATTGVDIVGGAQQSARVTLPPRRGQRGGPNRGGSSHYGSSAGSHHHVQASTRSPAAVALGMMQSSAAQSSVHHGHSSVVSDIIAGSHYHHFGSSAAQFGHSATTTATRKLSLQPRRGGAFHQQASNPMVTPASITGGGALGDVDEFLNQQLANASMLRRWLDAHDVPAIDYVDVLVHFVRVDSTRTDIVSLLHVLVGTAQLVNAVQASMALAGVGSPAPANLANSNNDGTAPLGAGRSSALANSSTGNNSPRASVTETSVATTGVAGGSGLSPSPTHNNGNGGVGTLSSPTQNAGLPGSGGPPLPEYQSNQSYAVRVMLFELQSLGSVLQRCRPLRKLSTTAAQLVIDLSIASFLNIAKIADGIPVVFKELMAVLVLRSESNNAHNNNKNVERHGNSDDNIVVIIEGSSPQIQFSPRGTSDVNNASGVLTEAEFTQPTRDPHQHSGSSRKGNAAQTNSASSPSTSTPPAALPSGAAGVLSITDPRHFIPLTNAPPPKIILELDLRGSEPLHVAVNILVSSGLCTLIVLGAYYDGRWEVEIPLGAALVLLISGWSIRYYYPLVGVALKIVATACCVVAFAVDMVLYNTRQIGAFPYWVVAVATALFYSCRLTDVPTFRLEGSRFQSPYLVDDLLYNEEFSDDDDEDGDEDDEASEDDEDGSEDDDDSDDSSSSGDDNRDHHQRQRQPASSKQQNETTAAGQQRQRRRSGGGIKSLSPSKLRRLQRQQRRGYMATLANDYTITYVPTQLALTILPFIVVASVIGGFAARVALDEDFRLAGSIVGEATVAMILMSVFIHHFFNAQQRRLAEDDALRLAYGIIRSTIDDIRAATMSAVASPQPPPGASMTAVTGFDGAAGGSGSTGLEQLAQRQITGSQQMVNPMSAFQTANMHQQRIRSQSHAVGGRGGSGGSTVVSPKMRDDTGNRTFSMPPAVAAASGGGQRPSNRVMPLAEDDMTSSVNQLLELENDGVLNAGGNNLRGASPGHRPKSPAVFRGGGGRPGQRAQSAVHSSGGALVKDMSSSHSAGGGDAVNTPMSQNHIVLAGKNIAPHGEMLLNLPPHPVSGKYPNSGGATGANGASVWRTPLDEVHLTTIVIGVDGRGDIVFWNWFAEDVTQFTAADMMGRNILSILPSSEYHAEMFSKISMTMSDRSTSTTRCSIVSRRVGKPTIDVALQAYPAKSLNGSTVGVIFAGSAIRHEALQDVAAQLLEIHSNMADTPSRSQLYQSLLLLQSELPKSTVEVSLPQFLGRIFSAQFQKRAVLLDVQPNFPSTIMIDVDALQLLVLEMLQHYMRAAGNGCVHIKLGHDEVAQVVVLKVTVELPMGSVRTTNPAEFANSLGSLIRDDVPLWKPSVTVAQAARKLNCIIRTDNGGNPNNLRPAPDCHCNITIVGAVAAGGAGRAAKGGSGGAVDSAISDDEVRCNVAIYDSETLSSTLIRNAVWERKHMLFFIEDAKKLSVALDGVDILFARFPRSLVEPIVTEIKQERPLLEIIVIASSESDAASAGGAVIPSAKFKNLPCIVMEDPILSSEIQDALTMKIRAIAARRLREDKVSDIRKLFSQTKSCPWVRGQLLGRGATAIVYEATNTITSGKMAVRTIRINSLEPEQLKLTMESLIAEVKLMSRLEHKNIINYLSLERDPDAINVFLEYAPGGSIRSLLDKRRVSIEQSAIWLRDILEGLSYLHSEGIVHLDLKSANVLLAADGSCKISDFGTAREIDPATRQTSSANGVSTSTTSLSGGATTTTTTSSSKESDASGTLHFMSPEMLQGGAIDWRSDIWSLGCMAMEIITGKLPFSQMGALAIVGYVSSLTISDTVELPREIHRDMNAVSFITACLCVDPAGRPNARTLQNHPFIVQQSGRQLTMPQPAAQPTSGGAAGGNGKAGGRAPGFTTESSDDEENDRRESCFSSWSAQDQFQERRRATAADW